MTTIDPIGSGPYRDLFLAINCYISTGDHIGEGVAYPQGRYLIATIAVNPSDQTDRADFEHLRQRLEEIKGDFPGLKLGPPQYEGAFWMHELRIPDRDVNRLAAVLARSCGAAGWGSPKSIIDQHPDIAMAIAKIASGEGA